MVVMLSPSNGKTLCDPLVAPPDNFQNDLTLVIMKIF